MRTSAFLSKLRGLPEPMSNMKPSSFWTVAGVSSGAGPKPKDDAASPSALGGFLGGKALKCHP
jgi:hypothetical protein